MQEHDEEKTGLQEDGMLEGEKTIIGQMNANQVAEAYAAALTEHRMGFWEACKAYKKALWWTLVMGMVSHRSTGCGRADICSQAIIMESYDTILVGSFYALPAFQQRFGHQLPNGTYQLTAGWQSALCGSPG